MMMKKVMSAAALMAFTPCLWADAGVGEQAQSIMAEYEMGDYSAFKVRLNTLNHDIAEKGVLHHVELGMDLLTGYSYHQVYDWDTYFENLYLSYYGVSTYCMTNTRAFLRKQKADGFISRTIDQSRPKQHYKPFLAQMAELGCRQTGDYEWLKENIVGMEGDEMSLFARLDASIEYWFEKWDADKNGLPVWNSADHSGMDNQWNRAGGMDEFRVEGVDLACYLHREYLAMAAMAYQLGMSDKQAHYAQKAAALADNINKVFWCEEDGFYYDRDEKSGKTVKVMAVSGFTPMWAGVASKEQASRLVEHMTNPDEFWGNYPVTTYAKTAPSYNPHNIMRGDYTVCNWCGPAWIPTNYMVFHGLLDYGYTDIAKKLAAKTFEMVYKQNDITREFYDSVTGKGLGLPRFWGWSSLGYTMAVEMGLDYSPSKIGGELRPILTEIFKIDFPAIPTELYQIGK